MKELTCGPAGWQDRCPAGSPNTLEILAVDILWRLPIIVLIVRYLILYGDRCSGQNRLLVVFDKALPLQLREDRTSSQRDGTLTIIKENSPTSFEVQQNVETKRGAKTCSLDRKTNQIVLITAEPDPAAQGQGGRNRWLPDSFTILVVGK